MCWILFACSAVDILLSLIHSLTLKSFSSFFFLLFDFSSIFLTRISYLFYYLMFFVGLFSSILLNRIVLSFFILSSLESETSVLISNYLLSFLLNFNSLLVTDLWTKLSNLENYFVEDDLTLLWFNILPPWGLTFGYYNLFVFIFSYKVKKLLKSNTFTLFMGLDII
jgi:hypothetical protein